MASIDNSDSDAGNNLQPVQNHAAAGQRQHSQQPADAANTSPEAEEQSELPLLTPNRARTPDVRRSNSGATGLWSAPLKSTTFEEYLGELEGRNEAATGTGDLLRNYMNLRRKRFGGVFGQKSETSKPAEDAKTSEQARMEKKDGAQ